MFAPVRQVPRHRHTPAGEALLATWRVLVGDANPLHFARLGIDDDDGYIGLTEQEEVACDFFIGAGRLERVRAGQVHDLDAVPVVTEHALGAHDRLAGPVAGVLVQPGERVEEGGLAHVGEAHDA